MLNFFFFFFFNHYFFQEEYVSEGLQWSFVKYQDNQSCLDLLEGSPISVFSLLNEVCWPSRNKQKEISYRLKKKLKKTKFQHFTKLGLILHHLFSCLLLVLGHLRKNVPDKQSEYNLLPSEYHLCGHFMTRGLLYFVAYLNKSR